MKKAIWLLVAPLLVGVLLMPAFSQQDREVVDSWGFSENQRPLPIFRHDEHNEIAGIEECNECHHVYEDGEKLEDESSEDQSCSDCHEEQDSGRRPGLRKAFHANCKGCHLERNKGPVMCGTCHVRE